MLTFGGRRSRVDRDRGRPNGGSIAEDGANPLGPQKPNLGVSNSTHRIELARVAGHWEVSTGVAISAQVKLLNRAETQDRRLGSKLKRLESKLQVELGKIESGDPLETRQSN